MIDFQLVLEKLPAFFGGGDGHAVMSTRDGLLLTLELLFISPAARHGDGGTHGADAGVQEPPGLWLRPRL